jgi:hypothetical protein
MVDGSWTSDIEMSGSEGRGGRRGHTGYQGCY